MTSTNGWTQEDYKTLHDLLVKANLSNLEFMADQAEAHIPMRAEQMVMRMSWGDCYE